MSPNAGSRNDTARVRSPLVQMLGLIQLMRPKQWIKNSFVLAPLVFSGAFLNIDAVGRALLAMVLFCVGASATYIVNDIHDMERDRQHLNKSKTRPLAAGVVSVPAALILLAVLYAVLVWGWFIAPKVVIVIAAYLLLNLAYTFVLKHQPVVDIFMEMSATGALLFYSMFVISAKPQLVITVPLVLFGLFRYWFVVEALDGGESPTDALLSDWQLLATVVLWVAACGWTLWPVHG